MAAVKLKQGGTEMRAGGVASRAFSGLVVLLFCPVTHLEAIAIGMIPSDIW